MIVGTKYINLEELAEHIKKGANLDIYCLSLVPKYLQHITPIVMNQKYVVALHIRKIESIPYKIRKEKCETLLSSIHLTGVPTQLIDMGDIMCRVDVDKIVRYIEENK